MSSYRGGRVEAGAWDGGPPGAEADYVPPAQAPPLAAPLPTTDPWTGVSYSQYGQPQYDYQAYSASAPPYGYNYDSTQYYQRPESTYFDNSRAPYLPAPDYDYNQSRESRSKRVSRDYDRQRSSYRSDSRSPSPYNRERDYSKKRESSYDGRRRRSRSLSKPKHSKYSSSDRSSRSRSYSESPTKKGKSKRRSASSNSSRSERSYKKKEVRRIDHSLTPPLKGRTSRNRSYGKEQDKSRSPRYSQEKSKSKRSASRKPTKSKDARERDVLTPPRIRSTSPKPHKKSDRSSGTPPTTYKRSERSPLKKIKRERESRTPPPRDSSVTPPRCYARSRSSSTSRSRSRSLTPKSKRKRSRTPKVRRSRSSSSSESSRSSRSRPKARRSRRKSSSKHRSRSTSHSKERSRSKTRSKSRRHSGSRFRGRRSRSHNESKISRSRSRSSRSRSRSRTPSDEECRGQFTVADRKRFWKLHRNRQEQAEKCRTPPKEVKPPPGAIESTTVDDITYGDPPEVEGPNFADLLPTPDQVMQVPSSSKSKPLPIPIKNDGSFLEMFKKMQEQTKKAEEAEKKPEIKKPVLPFIGKRRGGRVLKTGLVKKAKAIDEQTVDNTPKDAWSLYMQEVKKYRETSCEEERKTRPLVK